MLTQDIPLFIGRRGTKGRELDVFRDPEDHHARRGPHDDPPGAAVGEQVLGPGLCHTF